MIKLTKKRTGVMCNGCGKILVSWHVHDYKTCSCPNETMIDGGDSYLRYGGKDMTLITCIEVKPLKESPHVTKFKKKMNRVVNE